MTDILRFVPGQFWQSACEEISYTIGVGNVATAPTSASMVIWNNSTNSNASCLQSSGSAGPTISTCYITTPCIISLSANTDYRVWLKFEQGGEVFQGYFDVTGVA